MYICQEEGTLLPYWWECKWYSHCGEQYGASLKIKNRAPIRSIYLTPECIPRENHNRKDTCTPVFIAALPAIARAAIARAL